MEKNKVEDLYGTIRFLKEKSIISSARRIKELKVEPIFRLIHNEILSFTKKELDSAKDNKKNFAYDNLLDATVSISNPYLMSAILKKKACLKNLSKEGAWILQKNEKKEDELYDLIYIIEGSKKRDVKEKKSYFLENIFKYITSNYVAMENDTKIKLVNEFFNDFGVFSEQFLIERLFKGSVGPADIFNLVVEKLKEKDIDFSKYPLNDVFFSRHDNFISANDEKLLKILIDAGFRFDENKYEYNGENLFINVLRMNRKNLNEIILPSLTDISPKKKTIEEQNQFVDSLDESKFSKEKKMYFVLLLESSLNHKEEEKKKLKI